jgi:glycerophosphoryl diester phosphodiesterase
LDERVDSIITTPVESVSAQEIIDARKRAPTLGKRINSIDTVTKAVKSNVFGGFIAHRGLCAVAPENTLKAIAAAGRMGYARVEIDPQITKEGYWILMHDPTVDRTTDGTGYVSELTLDEIRALRIDTPANQIADDEIIRVPLFEEALAEAAAYGLGTNIDGAKFWWSQYHFDLLMGLLKKYNLLEKSWIYFTSQAQRQASHQYAPDLAIAWTTTPANIVADLAEAANYREAILIYHVNELTDTVIELCAEAGVDVMAYRADSLESAYKWVAKGVKYIETDYILPGSEV